MPLTQETKSLLESHAGGADADALWPAVSWDALRDEGGLRWCIPVLYEGEGKTGTDLLERYETVAAACLTTCFILSQRDAACRRIRESGNEALCRELLPPLARGESLATVGLSQLTTSRQHGRPSLTARLTNSSLILDGTIPWVTGAARADYFVIGAVLDDGRQIMAAVPKDAGRIEVGPPLGLMALQGALTAEVRCANVAVDRKWVLAGPAERVLIPGRSGTGGLETSCLAIGLAVSAVAFLRRETATRPDLGSATEKLELACAKTREEMHRLASEGATPEGAATLRAKANSLVLRASQAALTAAKGTGFLRDHPAQRWARQALFFLVWSCPAPVARATLDSLACDF